MVKMFSLCVVVAEILLKEAHIIEWKSSFENLWWTHYNKADFHDV